MTEKRFIAKGLIEGVPPIWCNDEIIDQEDVAKLLNELSDENEQLKKDCSILVQSNQEYRKENEQLKQRNDRQAKRLAELYELMAKKDWESLTEIIDDFCSCEEQLQRESGTYGGFE